MADVATTLTVQVSEAALARLKDLAARRELSPADLVGEALDAYLDLQDWQVAAIEEAVKEADAGGPFIDHEEVVAWARSLGTENQLPRPE